MDTNYYDMKQFQPVMIEYEINGEGSFADLRKRNNILLILHQLLVENNLGFGDDSAMGTGIMQIWCFVNNKHRAIPLIVEILRKTEFANFRTIY